MGTKLDYTDYTFGCAGGFSLRECGFREEEMKRSSK
jgi:hypothetical protein